MNEKDLFAQNALLQAAWTVFPFHYHRQNECIKPGAQRECVCEVSPIKVHQQVTATLHHAELRIQSYTHRHTRSHTYMHGWADTSRRLTTGLSASRFLKSPLRETERPWDMTFIYHFLHWFCDNSNQIGCSVSHQGHHNRYVPDLSNNRGRTDECWSCRIILCRCLSD